MEFVLLSEQFVPLRRFQAVAIAIDQKENFDSYIKHLQWKLKPLSRASFPFGFVTTISTLT